MRSSPPRPGALRSKAQRRSPDNAYKAPMFEALVKRAILAAAS